MATLQGQKPQDTYKDLLQVSNSNAGIDATLRPLVDGEGTPSLLQLSSANVAVGSSTIDTAATDGFLYQPGCPGTPTGTPTTVTGRVPLVVDVTNNVLYFFSSGWKALHGWVLSALGDLVYGGASGVPTRLAGNTTATKKFLTQTGDGTVSAAPGWNALVAGDIPDISATYSPLAGSTSLTTVGTVTAGVWSGTAVAAIKGGTGQTSYTKGNLLAAADSVTLNKLAVGTDGQVLTADSVSTNGVKWSTPAATTAGADPSATIGLSVVNGSATTAMRSDGAPALSQAISPTWTGVHAFTPAARSSGSAAYLTITAPGDTSLTASTEAIGVSFVGATRQHQTGTVALQREVVFSAPTYSAVAASTFTAVVNVEILAPIVGTSATFTASSALRVFSAVTGTGAGLTCKGGGGTGNILEARDSSNVVQTWADSSGYLHTNFLDCLAGSGGRIGGSGGSVNLYNAQNWALFTSAAAGNLVAQYKAAASRSAAIINFQTSAPGTLGNVSGGCIGDTIGDVTTTHTDGTFDTLLTRSTVANALIVNGDKIKFRITLTVVSHTTNTAEFKLTYGGVAFWTSGAITFATTGTVVIEGTIYRVSSTTGRADGTMTQAGSTSAVSVPFYVSEATLTGLTLTGANNFVVSAAAAGTGAAAGDIALVTGSTWIDGFGS